MGPPEYTRGNPGFDRTGTRFSSGCSDPFRTLYRGLSGETGEDFAEMLAFLADVRLDSVGVFPYYRRRGSGGRPFTEQVHPLPLRRARLV